MPVGVFAIPFTVLVVKESVMVGARVVKLQMDAEGSLQVMGYGF